MHRLPVCFLTLVIVVSAVSRLANGAESGVTAMLHSWGRFDPGCWKLVRVISETLDEQGQVVSTCTTDTKTTLVDIDNEGVTLEVSARMEVAGKRFQADPQTIKQGFHGEVADPHLSIKPPVDGEVVIGARSIPCKVQQLEAEGPKGKTVINVYYSSSVAPYVLKRECITTGSDAATPPSELTMEVIALDMPVRLNDQIRTGVHVRTVQRNGKGTVTTLAIVIPDVPGGVVRHSSKEVDKNGRVIRRSTLEVLDYCNDVANLYGRKRANRRTKSPPH